MKILKSRTVLMYQPLKLFFTALILENEQFGKRGEDFISTGLG